MWEFLFLSGISLIYCWIVNVTTSFHGEVIHYLIIVVFLLLYFCSIDCCSIFILFYLLYHHYWDLKPFLSIDYKAWSVSHVSWVSESLGRALVEREIRRVIKGGVSLKIGMTIVIRITKQGTFRSQEDEKLKRWRNKRSRLLRPKRRLL